ncbi:hypothetical protein [Prosthecobacter sp.]|uniref:hypothetical protein n=1 Tax=Prosthecobacter sp. TaxID=1965333 RepID=UPI002489E3AA|nr:hypothetical protein [Prosthecobacter sp.]MDI1310596.1 hypothetical protein [Prosthecobacter sp.]
MKKPLLTLLLPLLLAATLLCTLRDKDGPTPSAPAHVAAAAAAPATQPSRLAIPSPADQRAAFEAVVQKMEDQNEKLREHATKAFSNMSPKLERRLLATVMRFREPRCRQLFSTWKLDAETADAAIKLIEAHQAEVMTRRRDFLMSGIHGAPDYRIDKSVNQALAEVQLTALLGEARSAELRALEKQIDAEYLARALRNAAD